MSEPEIARRCTACGVSVRKSAMFCPQCGNPIVRYQTTDAPQVAETQSLHTVTTVDDSPPESVRDSPRDSPPQQDSQPAHIQAVHTTPHPAALAGVAENVRESVEKIRHVSHVVIDQAAYDPSLRFLLVAALLFLLFIVLVIISKVLG